jgi:hypothetical protein
MRNARWILAVAILTPITAFAQTDTLSQKASEELRSLRMELLDEMLVRSVERIESLNATLEGLRGDRLRLDEMLKSHEDEARNWSQELLASEFNAGERVQMEAAKTASDADLAGSLGRQRQAIAERETSLTARLAREKERHRRLEQTLRTLQSQP